MDPLAGFDSANELAKQLITLATGILALSITFIKDVLKNNGTVVKWPLRAAWFIYLFSIFFGMWTMMAITGSIFSVVSNSTSTQSVTNSIESLTNSNQSVTNSAQPVTNSNQSAMKPVKSAANSNHSVTNTTQTGTSTQSLKTSNQSANYGANVAIPAMLQLGAFLFATLFLIWYGAKML